MTNENTNDKNANALSICYTLTLSTLNSVNSSKAEARKER